MKLHLPMFAILLLSFSAFNAFAQDANLSEYEIERDKLTEIWFDDMDSDCSKGNQFLDTYAALIPNAETDADKNINRARKKISIIVLDECNLSCDNEAFKLGRKLAFNVKNEICGPVSLAFAVIPDRCTASLKIDCLAGVELFISSYCSSAINSSAHLQAKEQCNQLEISFDAKNS